MPKIFELFGYPITNRNTDIEASRKLALCPFMQAMCDGGGNRHQTRIRLTVNDSLRDYFDNTISSVIPGICSISAGNDIWVVCPRRLFAAKHTGSTNPATNFALQSHERTVLLKAGLPQGKDFGIWSEVFLKQRIDETEINYHFDYVILPLTETTLLSFLQKLEVSEKDIKNELRLFTFHLRKQGYISSNIKEVHELSMRLPIIEHPLIFEIMTASTSGSDTENETDIRGAFRNAVLGRDHESPGINKRQVWGRMITQLFAKTALAAFWGGQTLWIIQDELLHNIELTTLLKTSKIITHPGNDIHLLVMGYEELSENKNALLFKKAVSGDSGLAFTGSNTFTDILLPKITPSKLEFAIALLRRPIDAIVRL
ncbi:MAG: hypothetical protein EI684_17485 [Candidatus Viridilinea halotolerans]|uniref:Restriction endonuclease type II NotI domain-containing protein n=1 Tax=Candidatus Viridilinea halotolerans TaxID=2491704 RepID=A0A426TU20_9CHLR|nr:MAG: hypothetical protein EI684_17485 [Candidatus Viridilinea halotolerans]